MKSSTIIGGASSQNSRNAADFYATPPECTVALLKNFQHLFEGGRVWEPACGNGAISEVLKDYRLDVISTDLHDRGYGDSGMNFLTADCICGSIITNPPFKTAEKFIIEAHRVARVGVAMLVRTVFLESIGRYERLFSQNSPSYFAQYVERVPMVKGRLDRKASTATGYGWIVWEKTQPKLSCSLKWIPPSRRRLEKDLDYQ